MINGQFSEWLPVLSGVPQGSILGPLSFILYIDDLYAVVKSSSLKIYADDVALYAEVWAISIGHHECLSFLILAKDADGAHYQMPWQNPLPEIGGHWISHSFDCFIRVF